MREVTVAKVLVDCVQMSHATALLYFKVVDKPSLTSHVRFSLFLFRCPIRVN
jgi:hypothetical protein